MAPENHVSVYVDQRAPIATKGDSLPCDLCPGQRLNICRPLERDRLAELLATGSRQKWAKGADLFTAGDRVRSVAKITKGMVALSQFLPDGRRQIFSFVLAGELCGMMEVEGRHALTARAITEVEGCVFARDRFDAFVERHVDVLHEQKRALQAELSFAASRALVLGRMLAHEKVAHFLLEFGDACARRGMNIQPLALPMTRSDIADYLGLTVETVCRTFADLKARGLIRTFDHSVLVLDRRRLETIATAGCRREPSKIIVTSRPALGRRGSAVVAGA